MQKISFVIIERSYFYELRQQQKRPKTMEMNEPGPDIYSERYIKFNLNPPTNSLRVAEALSLKISSHGSFFK